MILVIGLAGRIGSGKGTVAKYLVKKYNAQQFVYSDILADVLKRLNIDTTRTNFQKLGKSLREVFGKDIFVNAMKADLEAASSEVVLIDGVRYVNEANMLKTFPENKLIFIDVPLELRYERARKRAQKGEQDLSLDEFKERENAATEQEIGDVQAISDNVIDNSGTLEELYAQIDALMKK